MTPEKDPANYELITYAWVILLSLWGGTAGYIRRVRSMVTPRYSIVEFVGEMVIASLVGLMTFYLCAWANIDNMLSAVFIAISGHMGSRALLIGDQIVERYVKRKFNLKETNRSEVTGDRRGTKNEAE